MIWVLVTLGITCSLSLLARTVVWCGNGVSNFKCVQFCLFCMNLFLMTMSGGVVLGFPISLWFQNYASGWLIFLYEKENIELNVYSMHRTMFASSCMGVWLVFMRVILTLLHYSWSCAGNMRPRLMSIVCHGQKSDRFSVHVSSTVYGLSILHREVLFLQEEFSKSIIVWQTEMPAGLADNFYKVGVVWWQGAFPCSLIWQLRWSCISQNTN